MTRAMILFCSLGLSGALADSKDDADKKDLDLMQGDWAVVEYVVDGVKLEDDNAQSIFRTVKGNQYTVYLYEKPLSSGTIKLDAGRKPKHIDSLPDKMPDKSILGIYEIERDRMKVCYAAPGKDRPTEFESKKGSGHTFVIWEREKMEK